MISKIKRTLEEHRKLHQKAELTLDLSKLNFNLDALDLCGWFGLANAVIALINSQTEKVILKKQWPKSVIIVLPKDVFYTLETRKVLNPELSQAEYDKAEAAAWAEYKKVKAAQTEYNKVAAAAWAEYDKTEAAAWAEYNKVIAPALAELKKVKAAAMSERNKVKAAAIPFRQKVHGGISQLEYIRRTCIMGARYCSVEIAWVGGN